MMMATAFQPRVLVVEDEDDLRRVMCEHLADCRRELRGAGSVQEAVALLRDEGPFDLLLLDVRLPGASGLDLLEYVRHIEEPPEVVIITGHASVEDAVRAMRGGAADYLRKPLHLAELDLTVDRVLERRRLHAEVRRLQHLGACPEATIVGNHPAVVRLREAIARAADSDATVLIEGESGTGKELVARSIHDQGRRAKRPLVVLNCATLRQGLMDSELFGHVRGSFTGATGDRSGLLEVADGSTLFVDEVGELEPQFQPRFLRFLESGEVLPVGSTRARRSDVRIVAATNRDLEQEVEAGRFRADLFYRLNVVQLKVPPLRARLSDLALLVTHFVSRSSSRRGRDVRLTPAAWARLRSHGWPGNVRELANVVERGLVSCCGDLVDVADLHLPPLAPSLLLVAGSDSIPELSEVERQHIDRVLRLQGFNKRAAARCLGISLRTLYRKLDRYGPTT